MGDAEPDRQSGVGCGPRARQHCTSWGGPRRPIRNTATARSRRRSWLARQGGARSGTALVQSRRNVAAFDMEGSPISAAAIPDAPPIDASRNRSGWPFRDRMPSGSGPLPAPYHLLTPSPDSLVRPLSRVLPIVTCVPAAFDWGHQDHVSASRQRNEGRQRAEVERLLHPAADPSPAPERPALPRCS